MIQERIDETTRPEIEIANDERIEREQRIAKRMEEERATEAFINGALELKSWVNKRICELDTKSGRQEYTQDLPISVLKNKSFYNDISVVKTRRALMDTFKEHGSA